MGRTSGGPHVPPQRPYPARGPGAHPPGPTARGSPWHNLYKLDKPSGYTYPPEGIL